MISVEEQNSYDFDWFAVDSEGYLAHFASGGCSLPKSIGEFFDSISIMMLAEDVQSINDSSEFVINPELTNLKELNDENSLKNYVRTFVAYARKGLYSYDTAQPARLHNKEYHLIASPVNRLNINALPQSISRLIKTSYLGKFKNAVTIDIRLIS